MWKIPVKMYPSKPEVNPLPAAKQYRSDIDGLRALAVLSVLAFHSGTPGFSGGFVGVDTFFVISGYLICSIIIREIEQDRFSIAGFYERRCKRILPALFAVLLFCMIAALFLLSPGEARHFAKSVMATALSVSNVQFYLQGSYFDRMGILSPLLMTWSLAVEEQFYIVFPFLMLLLYKRNRRHLFSALALGCAVSLLFSIYAAEYRSPEFNFYLPFTRAWEIGAGTLLAVWQQHTQRRPQTRWLVHLLSGTGLLLVLACTVFYSPATRFPGYEAVPPVLGTLLLLYAEDGAANRFLSLRPFVAIGLISYSLYLWSWPLLSFAAIVGSEPAPPHTRAALVSLAACAATLSYFFVETPFRKARNRSTHRILTVYASLLLCVFLAGTALLATDGFSGRAPRLAQIEHSLGMDRAVRCINRAARGPILTPECVPPPSAKRVFALLGDSHAEAIEETLRGLVTAGGQELLVLTSYSCPPLQGFTRELPEAPEHAQACARFNLRALDIVTHRPDVNVVVLIGNWAMVPEDKFVPAESVIDLAHLSTKQSQANLIHGIEAEISALESAGKQVVLLDDWPSLTFVPLQRVKYSQLPMRRRAATIVLGRSLPDGSATSVPRVQTVTPSAEAIRVAFLALAQKDPHLRVVDTKQILCDEADCSFSYDGQLLYTDGNHASHFGAERILAKASADSISGNIF